MLLLAHLGSQVSLYCCGSLGCKHSDDNNLEAKPIFSLENVWALFAALFLVSYKKDLNVFVGLLSPKLILIYVQTTVFCYFSHRRHVELS